MTVHAQVVAAKAVVERVVVYCIAEGGLLAFREFDLPPEQAGVQVPDGRIKPGEKPQDAALRALFESTGRTGFEIVRRLCVSAYDMSPARFEIQNRHFFLARPTARLPATWESHDAAPVDGAGSARARRFFWLPLTAAHVLQAGQGAWIWVAIEPA